MSSMYMTRSIRRTLRLAALLPALALAAACGDDDPVEVEEEPTFTRMRLVFQPQTGAPQTVEITRANAAVSGPLTIPAGGGTIAVTYLNADGSSDAIIAGNTTDFETRINRPAAFTAATFTRTGPHAFTVTRSAAGSGTVQVQLFHLGENHDELEANVTVNVQ